MNFIDCALLTLLNAAVCLTLPKLLLVLSTLKVKRDRTPQPISVKVPSFP